MKSNVKKILFIFSLISLFIFTIYIKSPIKIGSSLTDLLPQNKRIPTSFFNKFSSSINIIISSKNFPLLKETSDNIYKKLTTQGFKEINYKIETFSINKIKEFLLNHKNSFLNINDEKLLDERRYTNLTNNAINQLFTSWLPPIIEITKDPFLLITNYIKTITPNLTNWSEKEGIIWQEKNGTHYVFINLTTSQNINEMIKEVEITKKIIKEHISPNIKINISGAPLHTITTYNKCNFQILIFSIISFLTVLLLTKNLFKDYKHIIKIGINLLTSFLGATTILLLFSSDIHFITFAFGSSLIGICIDYSYHYYSIKNNKKETLKNITHSYITTALCFAPLLFSNLSILRQIAIFIIAGLSTTYLLLLTERNNKIKEIPNCKKTILSKTNKIIILTSILIISIIGIFFVKIDNSAQHLYTPSKKLLEQEKTFLTLNGPQLTNFLIIKDKTLENLLQTEELLKKDFNFFSLSTLLPSKSTQIKRESLIKNLYNNQAKIIKQELNLTTLPTFKKSQFIDEAIFKHTFGDKLFKQFLTTENNYIYSIIPLTKKLNIDKENIFEFSPQQSIITQLNLLSKQSYQLLGYSIITLSLFLVLSYKRKTIYYITPSILGTIFTISLLSISGNTLTFFHILSLFIVIGLTIDYSIFHMDNSSNTKVIFYSFLTSFISFGLLSFVDFQLISSMGKTIFIGLGSSYFLSRFIFTKLPPTQVQKL